MSIPILIRTIGSAKSSSTLSGRDANNSSILAAILTLGLVEKSRSALLGKRGIGHFCFCPHPCQPFRRSNVPNWTMLMRNGRDRRLGKPVMGHAILERVLLVGTRSADHIRASGHCGCIAMEVSPPFENRPDTWLHPNASQISQIPSCTSGAVHTWPFASLRCAEQ